MVHHRTVHAQPVHLHATHGCSCSSRSSRHIPAALIDESGWGELTADRSSSTSSSTKRSQGGDTSKPRSSTGSATRARRAIQQDHSTSSRTSRSTDGNGWYGDVEADSDEDSWYDSSSSSSRRNRRSSRGGREQAAVHQDDSRGRQQRRSPPSAAAAGTAVEPRSARPSLFGSNRSSSSSSYSIFGTSSSTSSSTYGHGSSTRSSTAADHPDALPGDWVCTECGNLNYARRLECRSCEAPRPPRPSSSNSSGSNTFAPQPGDWTCPNCSDVNFAWRTECRSCQEPRPKSAAVGNSRGNIKGSSSSGEGRDKKVKKKKASSLVDKGVACCYGCGAPLQTEVPAAAGYVSPDKFEAKKKHKQLQQVRDVGCW